MNESFKLTGSLTFDTVQSTLQRLVQTLQRTQVAPIDLDLRDISQCDSAGLAFLIEAKKLGNKYQREIKIEGVSPSIHNLAEFCGVSFIFNQG